MSRVMKVMDEVMIGRGLTCFLSFPETQMEIAKIMYSQVIPALQELGIEPLVAGKAKGEGLSIHDSVVKSIKSADFFVCDLTIANPNVIYELGLAHAWGKSTILISQLSDNIPLDLYSKYPVIIYGYGQLIEPNVMLKQELKKTFVNLLHRPKSLQTPTLLRYIDVPKTVGIEILSRKIDVIRAFTFIGQFLEYFCREGQPASLQIEELRTGSVGAWIRSGVEPITQLIEKIIFLIPEWKMKLARGEKIRAQAEKIRAQAEYIKSETKRNEVSGFLEVIDKAQELGLTRITLGDQLKIETKPDNVLEIGPPEKAKQQDL